MKHILLPEKQTLKLRAIALSHGYPANIYLRMLIDSQPDPPAHLIAQVERTNELRTKRKAVSKALSMPIMSLEEGTILQKIQEVAERREQARLSGKEPTLEDHGFAILPEGGDTE